MQAIAAPPDSDRDLTINVGNATTSQAEALVVATKPVSVKLDGGKAQPTAPVQLQFDLSDRPDIVTEIMDSTVVLVVESASETNPSERDMFPGTWSAATKTLTAEVTHLTDFWVSAFNVFKAIENGIGRTFEFLRGDSTSPCREQSVLTIDDTEYVLTAVSPGAIAGCLVDNNGSVAIEFENATGGFYAILVTPEDIGGNWVVTRPLDFSDSAGSLVVGLMPNNKGVLAGRSSGRLTLNPGIAKGDVRMMPQPHGILVKSLLSGVSMFGIDLKGFDDIPEVWDCFVTGVNVANIDGSVTAPELTGMVGGIAQCLITAEAGNSTDKLKLAALHRLSTATALLTELPQQLWDFTASGLQDAAQNSVKDFRLRSLIESRENSGPEPSPANTAIDRVDVTTWAYDRVEGDTYVADNTGAKQIEVFWKSFAGVNQVRSGCTSTIRIEGPGTSETKDSSGCDSYNPGTYVKARSPGVHTVTVTVRQEGQPDFTAQRTVTVLPHN
ncbi:hypothetical protein [Mycobacterium sp. GA-1199]|uniref:hypothetical protein n=1 Tax=Mycobacterium sp. GA-1199 TaxID=1772287 RepID=UPI000A40FE1C|nr:hypothetical protein [Mycobacterium sp. GA-1199]